jgi:long-chain fatty acid transport protein
LLAPAQGGTGGAAAGINFAYFNADRGTDKFSQQLTTSGFAPNFGFAWQATPALSIGAAYHGKTTLSDFSGSGSMTVDFNGGVAGGRNTGTFNGQFRVINLQWPSSASLGVAYQATDKLMLAADVKNINWSQTFQQIHIRFTTGAGILDMGLNQNFKDQNIAQLGMAYKVTDALTLRAGASLTDNPVPAGNMFYLFPATIANTYTMGAGYALSKYSSVDFSLSIAPSVSVTNPGVGAAAAGTGLTGLPSTTSTHSQSNNWQLMFSQKF